ncbi:double homeobox protein A [Tupaia chinensis]|uniref:Double homeobox protein A n=1 Tax=Tupaia chinensis TaxID=246437 RepID=L9LCU0_TUPCH|nr:double homeobox protein A [Tupaia chinensis]ELW71537.1 Double homeobox protein A [Tupaia chinensis]
MDNVQQNLHGDICLLDPYLTTSNCLRHGPEQLPKLTQTVVTHHRRSHTEFTGDQLKIPINTFNQKPYPDYETKRELAEEVNTEESRIQIWFQNQRARHLLKKKSDLEKALESSEVPGQHHPAQQIRGTEDRWHHTSCSFSPLQTLNKAFLNNPYPGIDSREQLAKEIEVPESRVQIWFQNRRSRLHAQKKREPESLEQNERQDL